MKKWAFLLVAAAALVYWPLHSRADDGDGNPTGDDGSTLTPAAQPTIRQCAQDGSANPAELTCADVIAAVEAAAATYNDDRMVIAVTNRRGDILAVYRKPSAPDKVVGNFGLQQDTNEVAVALARTASFFSNDRAPLSSRTVRTISGVHFPPGVMYTPTAALYGIENTNRGCQLSDNFLPGQAVPQSRSVDGSVPGLGILTGKPDLSDTDSTLLNPGGVPLFKNNPEGLKADNEINHLVGGIGVAGIPPLQAEYAAFIGFATIAGKYGLPNLPFPGRVLIDGIELPFVQQLTRPGGTAAGTANGKYVAPLRDVDQKPGAIDSPGPVPVGYLVGPNPGPIGGLTKAEVDSIVQNTINTANNTRAIIRLPAGVPAKFIISVSDLDGTLIALYRMPDATIFSIDVAATKARNVIFFSGPNHKICSRSTNPLDSNGNLVCDFPGMTDMNISVSNRTIEWASQPFYPPGIDYSGPGAFFELYKYDSLHPCTQGTDSVSKATNKSGIVFFPGALPLYRNGKMIGGLGVSGDGVEQDDFATSAGVVGFEAPDQIRADQFFIDGARFPYIKFPRNPTILGN
jgi:uncharacterized protein GlcG (DUF336 family)